MMDTTALISLYNRYHDTNSVFKRSRWVTLEEANLLYTIGKEEKPSYIYESGTANGFSTLWLSLVGCPVMTFDPFSRPKVWDKVGGIPDNVTYIQAPFSNVTEKAHEIDGKKMFFIDGLHTSGGVNEDCNAVLENASSGDIVVFHDLNEASVFRCWHRTIALSSSYESYPTRRVVGKLIIK